MSEANDQFRDVEGELRDIAEVPAVEVINTTAVHLMSAAAVQVGLGSDGHPADLDEARKLINALAGLVTAAQRFDHGHIQDERTCLHIGLHTPAVEQFVFGHQYIEVIR